MGLAAASRAGQGSAAVAVVHAVAGTWCWTARSAVLPDLAQLAAQFLAGHGPVVADVIADLDHVPLDFQLVLFQPRDVQFLARGAALELAGDVLVVVADDSVFVSLLLASSMQGTYRVIIPVVLTPSVRWVTKNLPCALIGA